MRLFRTPDARFAALADWPFRPRYLTVAAPDGTPMRLHYVDEGGADEREREGRRPVLMLHGEPTWGYLYRHMIPPLAAEHRALALDFPGFGRSDKPASVADYTYDLHRQALVQFIEALDLRDVTLVVQDWGGLMGLPVAALDVPDRIGRLVILNTFLPTGIEKKPLSFKVWRASVWVLRRYLPVGALMRFALGKASDATIRAYQAPFPSPLYKAGVAAWPLLVPMKPDTPVARVMQQARAALRRWEKPARVYFSDNDPVLGGAFPFFLDLIPTATGERVRGGGHFLQDHRGPVLAQHVLDLLRNDAHA